ncbi:anti-sigma B factor antagonist [Catalinimonas alkaloidigena]|uniref:STAS domain-containing protein n=1 Tax=Catalinimonas alkaloidigena TaxID=1075417 RepID=UPI002405912B|nr:STAS domain-containing protein [Catalinimonas alkaloidigena]MDF9799854.1 anti-sigma B factor antagonist [Catalinimonas alkaloidigena]
MVDVSVDFGEKYCLIKINGEVDASSSIHLDEAMQKAVNAECPRILVDCLDLHYISSAGLGVFMSYIQELEAKEKKLVLFNMNEKVYKVFEILGLHQLLTIVDKEEDAKKDFVE